MPISQDQHVELLNAAQAYQRAFIQFQRRVNAAVVRALADNDFAYAVKQIALELEHAEKFKPTELSRADMVIQVELFRYTPQRQKENDYQKERKRIQRERRAALREAEGFSAPIPRNTTRPIIPSLDIKSEEDEYEEELTPEAAKVLEDDPEFREYLEGKLPKLTPTKSPRKSES